MRDMPQNINQELLAKFLSGEASTSEVDEVLDWLDASDENQKQFSQYEKVWLLTDSSERPAFDADAAWHKVNRRLSRRQLSTRVWLSSVAVAIIAFVLLFTPFVPRDEEVDTAPLFALSGLSETISTSLPDGSDIVLLPHSEIEYYLDSTTNTRTADLRGEAFFSIKRDTTQKFIVNTPYGGVEVLGTKFNVAVQDNNDVLVDVLSGKVKVFLVQEGGDTLVVIITNKESAVISQQNNSITKCEQGASAFYSVNETLTFRNMNIREVLSELEQCYNVTIEIDSTVTQNLKFTSSFKNDSIENILMIIGETLNLEYSKSSDKYLITHDEK